MRAVVGFVRCHAIAVGKLPMDLRMKVRKCGTIDEIVREEFFKNCEVSYSLDLFYL